MKTTNLKGVLNIKSGWLAIATSGNFETLKNKNLKDCDKKVVYVTIQDEAKYKTLLQNNLFHQLIKIYFNSNQHDYSEFYGRDLKSQAELKTDIKIRLGCGLQPIPKGKLNGELFDNVYLKSWAIYTLKEARTTLDNLMLEMAEKGIETDQERILFNELYKVKKNVEPELPIF